MGAWNDFVKWFVGNDSAEKTNTRENQSTNYLTKEELETYGESLYGQLQAMEDNLFTISQFMPKIADDLRHKIATLKTIMETTNSEDDIQTKDEFTKIKDLYEASLKRIEGLYVIKELEKQITNMKICFDKVPGKDGGISTEKLNEYKAWLRKIQDKVDERDQINDPILEKVDRARFNAISMEAGYRIKLLELMNESGYYGNNHENPFKGLSEQERIRYSNFLQKDLEALESQRDRMLTFEEKFEKFDKNGTYKHFFSRVEELGNHISDVLADATMIKDISISQLFDSNNTKIDSYDFLKKFVEFKILLNKLEDKIPEVLEAAEEERKKEAAKEEEREMEEAKKQEEENARNSRKEKYKNLTAEEIEKEIYRIEHDISAKGSRYVNILDFQKEVAQAKGLLDSSKTMQSDDLAYLVYDSSELFEIVRQANLAGVNYYVFPDCQEISNGKNLLVISKSDADCLKVTDLEMPKGVSYYGKEYQVLLGSYSKEVSKILLKRFLEEIKKVGLGDSVSLIARKNKSEQDLYNISITYNSSYCYSEVKSHIKDALLEVKYNIMNTNIYDGNFRVDMQDVLPYIEVPSTTNIIPILEDLNSQGITPYIEPNPTLQKSENKLSRNENERNNIHIYFERKDLEKVNTLNQDGKAYVIRQTDEAELIRGFKQTINWDNEIEEER